MRRSLNLTPPTRSASWLTTGLLSLLVLSAFLFPARTRAEKVPDPLESICTSSKTSLQALKTDPLLSSFFQTACGRSVESAIEEPSPVLPAEAPPLLSRDDMRPKLNSPEPVQPRLEVDPSIDKVRRQAQPDLRNSQESQAVIREVEIRGSTVPSAAALNTLLRPYIGRPIELDLLDQITQTIHAWYRSQGWLARVSMPSQDLSDGRVVVEVIESTFGGAEVLDPQGHLRNTQVPQRLVESHQKKGAPINLKNLEQASVSLRELSGVETEIQLKPGAAEGSTEAVIAVSPKVPIDTQIILDNQGSEATGKERINANLRLFNLTQRGDTLTSQALASKGMNYLRFAYELPFTAGGWRLATHVAHSNYELLTQEFESLDMRGPSQNAGLGLIAPIIRDPQNSLTLKLGLEHSRFRNEVIGEVISRYSSSVLGVQVDGQHTDRIVRGGLTQWAISVARGDLDLSDSPPDHQLGDSLSARTAGYFSKARASVSRRQFLDSANSVFASLQGQWADKNLDGSEKFFLGGARGVRAYPVNEAPGSAGYLLTLEWETRLIDYGNGRWTASGFYDRGEIERYKDVFSTSIRNRYGLQGFGLWLSHQSKIGSSNLGFKVTLARRIGNNPEASERGEDQDGTRIKNRVWFDANLQF